MLFSCINNEPVNKNEPWKLEKVFDCLLKSGYNPNQRNDNINRLPLIYALENKKYRAFERLLEEKDIDMSQIGDQNQSVLATLF